MFGEKITNVNVFFKTTVIKMNGLLRLTEADAEMTQKLTELQNLFQFTVAPANGRAIKEAKKVSKLYKKLSKLLEKSNQKEKTRAQELHLILVISKKIEEINALR